VKQQSTNAARLASPSSRALALSQAQQQQQQQQQEQQQAQQQEQQQAMGRWCLLGRATWALGVWALAQGRQMLVLRVSFVLLYICVVWQL
jgi:transcription initiation factor TFIID subunit TAF12